MPDPDFSHYRSIEVPVPETASLEPDRYTRLLERVVGEQISRVRPFDSKESNNPWQGATIGFEFRSHQRAFYWVRPVPPQLAAALGVCAALVPGYFPAQMIVTPRMERAMTTDRIADELAGLPALMRWVEGEIIRGVRVADDVNRWGGQSLRFELTADLTLWIHAAPGRAHGVRREDGTPSLYTANYTLALDRPGRTVSLPGPLVWTPGG